MTDFDLRRRDPDPELWPDGIASEDLVASLPPLAREKIRDSGKPAIINPLTDEDAREALALILEMADTIEKEKADYNASRSTLRAVCDFFLGTGKDDLFLTVPAAREAVGRALGIHDPEALINRLWLAGLVEISDFIAESENAAAMLMRFKEVIKVTERGRVLLDARRQPEALFQP